MPVDQERKRVIWKARHHALKILSMRHPEEFAQIRADLLAKWGHAPAAPRHPRPVPEPSQPETASTE